MSDPILAGATLRSKLHLYGKAQSRPGRKKGVLAASAALSGGNRRDGRPRLPPM